MAQTMDARGLAPLHSAILHFQKAMKVLRNHRQSKENEMKSLQKKRKFGWSCWDAGNTVGIFTCSRNLSILGVSQQDIVERQTCPKGDPNFRCLRWWSPEKAGDHRGVSEPFLQRHVTAEISKVCGFVCLIIWFDIIWYIDLTWCECVFFLTCYILLFAKTSQRWQSHNETVRMRHTMDSLSPALQQTLQTESVGSLVRVTLCDMCCDMWNFRIRYNSLTMALSAPNKKRHVWSNPKKWPILDTARLPEWTSKSSCCGYSRTRQCHEFA